MHEITDVSLPSFLVFLNNVSHVFVFSSLPLSPPLVRWTINSQPESQQQLLADRPDMRIAA